MEKLKSMDALGVRELQAAILPALEAVAKQIGVTVRTTGGVFDPVAGTFDAKIRFVLVGFDPDRVQFERNAKHFGMKADDYGREFTSGGTVYTICGIRPRATKMPITAQRGSGARYHFQTGDVLALLELEAIDPNEKTPAAMVAAALANAHGDAI